MKKSVKTGPERSVTWAAAAMLLSMCSALAPHASAAQAAGAFDVNISMHGAPPGSCGTANVAGGSLAIVCGDGATGASKVQVSDSTSTRGYRVLTHREDALSSVDAYGGAIATTAVRVLNVAGRQFIEMTVGW